MTQPETVSLLSWTGIERLLVIVAAMVAFFLLLVWIAYRIEDFSIYLKKKKAAEKARARPINVDTSQ